MPAPQKQKEKIASEIVARCEALASAIEARHASLLKELLNYESFETAEHELFLSIDCLRNVSEEAAWLSSGKVGLLCAFLPINLPLYSLIIFGVVPGFMAKKAVIRAPRLLHKALHTIWKLLDLKKLLPNISFTDLNRSLFNEGYIAVADAVIFTGRYENAAAVQKYCPNALFIYDGAGVNPIIVTDSANIPLAVKKTIEIRTFNSGQDCAGSNVIFVHEKVLAPFKQHLISEVSKVKVGSYQNRKVRVGRILKTDNLPVIQRFLDAHAKAILYGGKIDFENAIIHPTVILEDINATRNGKNTEFFAPIFYLLKYENNDDLKKYFERTQYADFAMYVTIFSNTTSGIKIPNSVMLHNQIIKDVERGNVPYGGYGPKSNYVSHHGNRYHRPILISKEIAFYLKEGSGK